MNLKDISSDKWLEKRKSDKSGGDLLYCRACKSFLGCSKNATMRHGESCNHKANLEVYEAIEDSHPQRISDMIFGNSQNTVMRFEMKLAMWLAENYLPLSLSDSLLDTLKDALRGDKIVAGATLGNTKCINIVRHVFGFSFLKDSVEYLRNNPFSILTDETTDISTKNQCAIIALNFDPVEKKIRIIFLDMIEMTEGCADHIARTIIT